MKKILSAILVFLIMLAALPIGISGWNAPAMAAEPVIVQIAAGKNHSLALFSDGSLYAWGNNHYGQLGDGTNINKNTPVKIGIGLPPLRPDIHTLLRSSRALYSHGEGTMNTNWAMERIPIEISR